MINRRNVLHDNNRNLNNIMEAQLRNVVEQQEAQIAALQARIQEMAAAQQEQQPVQPGQQPAQQEQQQFVLSTEQFLNYVQKLRIFNGKDEFTVQEFISSVEQTFRICNDTPGLAQYAMGVIINEKIQGEAKRCIQRLGTNRNWDAVKRELRLHFRPREDYAELLNRCRSLRVSTLRELFDSVREINYKLNELYEFDEAKPITYHPTNNDRYLVDIISSKIHDFLRGNIPDDATIIQLYNKFEKLKLLDNEDAVNFHSRKNKSNSLRNNKFCQDNVSFNRQNKNIPEKKVQSNNHPKMNNPNKTDNHNNFRNNFYNNSSQDHNNRNNYNNGSGQSRNRNQNLPPQRHNPEPFRNPNPLPEPMEIGNLNSDQDVNFFHEEPRNQNFQ